MQYHTNHAYSTKDADSGPYSDGVNNIAGLWVSRYNTGKRKEKARRTVGITKEEQRNFQSCTWCLHRFKSSPQSWLCTRRQPNMLE